MEKSREKKVTMHRSEDADPRTHQKTEHISPGDEISDEALLTAIAGGAEYLFHRGGLAEPPAQGMLSASRSDD